VKPQSDDSVKNEIEKITNLLARKKDWDSLPKQSILGNLILEELRGKNAGSMLKTLLEFSIGKAGVAPPKKEPPPKAFTVTFDDTPLIDEETS
jgi:hypothetical protein